ncbi:MAG: Eco57I restriction-modification methylase domain-containing protein, partial [Bacteroidia bacterium]
LDEFIKGIKKDHGDKAMKAVAAVSNRIRAEQARKPKTAPAEKPFLATAAAAQDGESLPPAVPDAPSQPVDRETGMAGELAGIRKKLETLGAARYGAINYTIQNAGTRGNGGHYWTRSEDGIRIEKGPAGRDVWSRELALDKLMAEVESDVRIATPIPVPKPPVRPVATKPTVPDVPKVERPKTPAISEQPAKAKPKGYGDSNKTFTKASADEARAELKKLMSGSQLNAGFDPKIVFYATQLGGYHVEAGARSFVAYSKEMIGELGEGIRPLLAYVYNQIRDYPGYDNAADMDSREDVAAYLRMQAKEEPIASPPALPDVKIEENDDALAGPNAPAPDDRDGDAEPGADDVRAPEGERPTGSGAGRPSRTGGRGVRSGKGSTRKPVRPGDDGAKPRPDDERGPDPAGAVSGDGSGIVGSPPVRAGTGRSTRDRSGLAPNYNAEPGALTRQGSWRQAAERNLDIIELGHKLDLEGRDPTPDEQALLAKFVGWGAGEIRNAVFPQNSITRQRNGTVTYNPDYVYDRAWKPIAERIAATLNSDELASALQSTQYAHYTSEPIVRGIWSAVQRLGFAGGKIIEPGMGVGLFPILAPSEVMADSHYTGIELDKQTAKTAKRLLPRETVLAVDYVKAKFPDGFFDLAIGNPPFANITITGDPAYKAQRFSLHDYFFAKTMDKLRPGGVMAFVTSRYTMDKLDPKARQFLADRADLLGAIRLPRTAFLANAGTEVVTDVIFLQKRAPGVAPGGEAWLMTGDVDINGEPRPINSYFVRHPEMVLGVHSTAGSMYRANEYTVQPIEGDLAEQFAAAVARLPEGAYQSKPAEIIQELNATTAKVDMDVGAKREGQVYQGDDGRLMRVDDGIGVALDSVERVSANDAMWIKGAVELREAVKAAQRAQLDDAPDWEAKLKAVNKVYDAFVAKHGPIRAFTTFDRVTKDEDGEEQVTTYKRFKNDRLIDMDLEGALLLPLEAISEDGRISKAPFLRGRTLKVPVQPKIENVRDAMFVSLDQVGSLNLPHVAGLYGKPVEAVIEELGNAIYEVPGSGYQTADEYLSGDVVTKLEVAQAAAAADPRYETNVKALQDVQPAPLTADKINVQLGSGWVPADVVAQFASEELGLELTASYEPTIGKWQVDTGQRAGKQPRWMRDAQRRQGAAGDYGHPDHSPLETLNAVLNNRDIQILKKTDDRPPKTFKDTVATTAVNAIADKMREAFSSWIWTDGERATEMLEIYNRTFNNIAPRRFDGSHLTLPGLSLNFPLHPHQKRVVWRMIQTGNTYLAHAVGAGKTLEMIVGAMEQRRLGLIKKPMFVVPNHMLNQFAGEFMEAYPAASILVADDKAFHTTRRQRFMAQAALNDLDGIVITHSAFTLLGTKDETRKAVVDRIISDLQSAIDSLGSGQETRITRSKLEAQIERIQRKFEGKASEEGKDQGLMFEDMGVDFINVDEAHEFRKLDFSTDKSVKGVDPNGSARALDLFIKTRFLESQRPGRSMVFASGTPITNTMAELYTLMRYLSEGDLDADGLRSFDAWSAMFGRTKTQAEQNAAGVYEMVTRYSKFVNVPELMKRVRRFADILTSNQLGNLVKRPAVKGGVPENVVVRPSVAVAEYMENTLLPRIETSRAWKPSREQPGNPDPMVAIITDARLSAIDMRFVDKNAKDDPDSKLNKMIDAIIDVYQRTKDDRYTDTVTGKVDPGRGSAQVVFSPVGFGEMVAKSRGFDARGAITKRLIAGGVKPSEIAWMSDYKTDAKKQAMFKAMRSGEKRILIGSPKNMGTGLNVQKRLKALHYLSPPWFPSDVEQPHGRILRQGNHNEEVELYWYASKGTYDGTGWGMVARKAKFIDDAYTGDDSVREIDDISEVSQYEMAAALAAGDERVIKLANLNSEIGRLELLEAAYHRKQRDLKGERNSLDWWLDRNRKMLAQYQKIATEFPAIETLEIKAGGETFDKPAAGGKALLNLLAGEAAAWGKDRESGERMNVPLGTVNGHRIVADFKFMTGQIAYQLKAEIGDEFVLDLGDRQWVSEIEQRSGAAPITTLTKFLKLGDAIKEAQTKIAEQLAQRQQIEDALAKPFEQGQKLAGKVAERAALEAELVASGDKGAAAAVVDSGLPTRDEIDDWENEGGAVRPLAWDESDVAKTKVLDQLATLPSPREDTETFRIGRLMIGANLTHPDWVAVRNAAEADLALLVRRLAGDQVKVKAFDAIRDPRGENGGRMVGGLYLRGMISMALTDGDGRLIENAQLRGSARHEVIHFLKESGVIPPGAWKALEAAAPEWRKSLGIEQGYGYQNLSEEALNEEAIAEAYSRWSMGTLKLAETKLSAMRRIKAFLAAIRDLVRRALGLEALPSPQSVFAMIESGALAEAASSPGGALETAEEARTALPSGASRITFSPDDLVENQEKLEELNYGALNYALGPRMRGSVGRNFDHFRR